LTVVAGKGKADEREERCRW